MKTLLTPFVLAATVWYWSRIRQLSRQPYLLEKAIFALGVSLASLDCESYFDTVGRFHIAYLS